MSQQKINKLSSAFTLIELIVVITILAILGTISFVSFNDYTKSARDSARVSDLTNISKGLAVYSTTNGTLPLPDKYTEVKDSSGTTISYQGYAGSTVLSLLNISGKVKDNLDKDYYYYTVNSSKSVFQLLGYSENSNTTFNIKNIISNTYAIDYSKRYIVTRGNEIGFLTSTTDNNPIYNGYNNNTYTGTTTLTTATSTLKLLVNSTTTTTGNGVQLTQKIKENIGDRYPGCDTDNIKIGNQVWSACNVGSTTAGTGASSYGYYFQWGRNDGLTSNSTTGTVLYTGSHREGGITLGHGNFIIGTAAFSGNWLTQTGTSNDPSWGQGPCANGYHVPASFDFQTVCNIVKGGICTNGELNAVLIQNFQNALIMPMPGFRRHDTGAPISPGLTAYYWASNTKNDKAYTVSFDTLMRPSFDTFHSRGLSVRCIKN